MNVNSFLRLLYSSYSWHPCMFLYETWQNVTNYVNQPLIKFHPSSADFCGRGSRLCKCLLHSVIPSRLQKNQKNWNQWALEYNWEVNHGYKAAALFSISWIFFVVKNNFLSLRLLKSERKWVQTSRAWLHFFQTANSKVPLSQSEADGHLDKCKKHRIVTILWGFVIIQELHGYEYRQKNLIVLMLCGHISCRK